MPESQHPIVQLLSDDPRYTLEAYQFVRDALAFGQRVIGLGSPGEGDSDPGDPFLSDAEQEEALEDLAQQLDAGDADEPHVERHLTGQQLCEAIRLYALEQFGLMAKVVLNSWGIRTTGDFGELVYNLIRIGMMKKSPQDRREDFDDCYDFDEAFQQEFRITVPED